MGVHSKYKEEYDKMLLDHMSEGYSFDSFAGTIGVAKRTLYDWKKQHKSFLHAQREGQSKSQKLFEKIAMDQMTGQNKGNAAVLIFWMKNRFNWSDKKEIDLHSDVKPSIIKKRDGSSEELTYINEEEDE